MKKGWAVIFIIVVVALALTIGNLKTYKYADSDEYVAGGTHISDAVKDIEINWVAGKVNIVTYDGDDIVLSEESNRTISEKNKMRWQLDGKTLRVQYAQSGLFRVNNISKDLTVKLPKSLSLDDVNITVVSAGVDAEIPDADKLKIVTVSGEVAVDCERINEVKADAVSGGVVLRFERVPEKIEAESVSGNVKIVLPEDAGFKVEFDSVSGSVNSVFPMERKSNDEYICGDERCEIDVDTVSGSLELDELK